jgi:hypothetical protein
VLCVTLPESAGRISGRFSFSLLKEFVVQLVQTRCFRFSRGRVARLSNGHFTLIRVGHCFIENLSSGSLHANATQTKARRTIGASMDDKNSTPSILLGNVLSVSGAGLLPTRKGIRPLSNFVYAGGVFGLIGDLSFR